MKASHLCQKREHQMIVQRQTFRPENTHAHQALMYSGTYVYAYVHMNIKEKEVLNLK